MKVSLVQWVLEVLIVSALGMVTGRLFHIVHAARLKEYGTVVVAVGKYCHSNWFEELSCLTGFWSWMSNNKLHYWDVVGQNELKYVMVLEEFHLWLPTIYKLADSL